MGQQPAKSEQSTDCKLQMTGNACRNGVELLINTKVESIDADVLTLKQQGQGGSRTVPYGACVWATGVSMHPLTRHLQEQMSPGSQTHSRLAAGLQPSTVQVKHAQSAAPHILWLC